jgi:hypothetical protein
LQLPALGPERWILGGQRVCRWCRARGVPAWHLAYCPHADSRRTRKAGHERQRGHRHARPRFARGGHNDAPHALDFLATERGVTKKGIVVLQMSSKFSHGLARF